MLRTLAQSLAVGILATALALLLASAGRASLHHPTDQRATIPVDSAGKPEPLPFEPANPAFKLRRVVVRNMGVPEWVGPEPTERRELGGRIKKEQQKPASRRTPEENLALAIDLLHYGKPDEAAGIFQERRGFLPNITLAHISIAQGQWAQADEYLSIANDETPPKQLPGTPPQKMAWQVKLNKGPLLKFVKLRLADSRGPKKPLEDELPDAIWPLKLNSRGEYDPRLNDPAEALKFVNDAGQYEPGKLAASEKAKLPGGDFDEAVATVQQLVLWFPFDVRLYWLLGELYAARGDLKAAQDIMDECVNSGRYSNRKVLMQHREAVAKAVANLPPPTQEEEKPDTPAVPFSFGAVWIYFGAVGVLALLALTRAVWKWRRKAA